MLSRCTSKGYLSVPERLHREENRVECYAGQELERSDMIDPPHRRVLSGPVVEPFQIVGELIAGHQLIERVGHPRELLSGDYRDHADVIVKIVAYRLGIDAVILRVIILLRIDL